MLDPSGRPQTAGAMALVRDGGVYALLVGDFDEAAARIGVRPNARSPDRDRRAGAARRAVPRVSATFPLDRAGAAHTALADGPAGKLVLVP